MEETDAVKELLAQLKVRLEDTPYKFDDDLDNVLENISYRWSGFCIANNDWDNLIVKFEFKYALCKDLYYGIILADKVNTDDNIATIDKIHNQPNCKNNTLWHYWEYVDSRFRYWDEDTFNILGGDYSLIIDYIINVLNYCDKIIIKSSKQ